MDSIRSMLTVNKTVKYLVLLLVFLFSACFSVYANNIQLKGKMNVMQVENGVATLEFEMSWDNSWRDGYNWDAAWIILRYQQAGNVGNAWKPIRLQEEGTGVDGGYTCHVNINKVDTTGVLIYRSADGEGTSVVTCSFKWPLPAGLAGMTKKDFDENKVFFLVQGVEMVYIPHGSYYLGDNQSKNTFKRGGKRVIPEEDDIIDLKSGYTYATYLSCYKNSTPSAAANHINNALWTDTCSTIVHVAKATHGDAALVDCWWSVDFKFPKTVRTFGVSGWYRADSGVPKNEPVGDWYLQASNDNVRWDTVWAGTPADYDCNLISYPVQNGLRVTKPGNYRYYRIFIPRVDYSGLVIANVAMSGKDLFPIENNAYLVEGEGKIAMGDRVSQLCADDDTTWTGDLPAAYPKGYKGFYVMKYEVSQEQYARFLNALTLAQQQNLIPGLTALNKGEFIFGDKATPTNRNGIIVSVPSDGTLPAVFDHNLNKNDKYGEDGDGKCLACNFMSINDMLAYCAWAGLRPMSELEYEKSCRRPYPDLPVKGEFAWNTAVAPTKVTSVTNGGTRSESTSAGNANYGSGLTDLGPVRCGLFATSSSTQALAGASFWGVMEMTGNLSELCVNVKHTAFAASTQGRGNFDLAVWGTTPAHFGLRGGGFTSDTAALAVSDRSAVTLADLTTRTNSVGFRGVFCPDTNWVKIDAGTITADKPSVCAGDPLNLSGTAATLSDGADLPFIYRWYVKIGSGNYQQIPNEMGATLMYKDLVNSGISMLSYTFKRKALCALGEGESNEVTVDVVNSTVRLSADTVWVGLCGKPFRVEVLAIKDVTAHFSWTYNGSEIDTGRVYIPQLAKLGDVGGSSKRVICEADMQGCRQNVSVVLDYSKMETVFASELDIDSCGQKVWDERDGQCYTTVNIPGTDGRADQCWFSQNLNTGVRVAGADYNTHTTAGIQKLCYGDKEENCDKYGGLYRWNETVNGENNGAIKYVSGLAGAIQGICPDGWHVPSDAEFKTLELNLGMASGAAAGQVGATSWRGTDQGTQLKMPGTFEGTAWCTGADCNKSGFNGLPGGRRTPSGGSFNQLGTDIYWWSSTKYNSTDSWVRSLNAAYATVYRNNNYSTAYGFSVRCVKKQEVASTKVTMENCGEVTVKDTREAVPQYYNTVKIPGMGGRADQCWFSQNMNIGTVVPGSDYNTHTVAGIQKICYGDDEKNCDKYGGLYSWNETVNGEKAGAIKYVSGTSGAIQGICPDGWHVASDVEFQTLEMNLGMASGAAAGQVGTTGWRGTDQGTQMKMPGTFEGTAWCTGADCNKSGFNGLPGGIRYYTGRSWGGLGSYTYWWSSTASGSNALDRALNSGQANVYRNADNRSYGFSVRCVKNQEVASTEVTMANCGEVVVKDTREAVPQYYNTVKIPGMGGRADQCWFSQNMNIGTVVPGADYNTHTTAGIQKLCYGDKEENCDKYGGLYSWNETVNGEKAGAIKYVSGTSGAIQGICPDGWHVPSDVEFQTLEMNLGMASGAAAGQVGATSWRGTDQGTQLKMPGTFEGTAWCTGADCNKSGFNGLPGGYRYDSGGSFSYLGSHTWWWSSTLTGSTAWDRYLNSGYATVYRANDAVTPYGLSVRCVKN